MATAPFVRAVETSALRYLRTIRGSLVTTFLNPVLFLAAMGLGLGSVVDDGGRAADLPGDSYLAFLGPGLLAAAAMQTAAAEGSYSVMAGIKWTKSFHAALATPLGARDLAIGQLAWLAVRVTITAVAFTIVLALFGAGESAALVLAVPAAVLVGVAHGAPITAYTASLQNEYGLATLFRFVVVPLFLFSGTFFPVDQLPGWLRPVAWATPLWHGVDLCRSLALGTATLGGAALHVAYLAAWVAVGTALAVRQFRRRLVT